MVSLLNAIYETEDITQIPLFARSTVKKNTSGRGIQFQTKDKLLEVLSFITLQIGLEPLPKEFLARINGEFIKSKAVYTALDNILIPVLQNNNPEQNLVSGYKWIIQYLDILGEYINLPESIVELREELTRITKKYAVLISINNQTVGLLHPDIKYNGEGLVHCIDGAAITYTNGKKSYYINGLKVDEYLACTPAQDLNIKIFTQSNNMDYRSCFIFKAGIEKLLDLGTVLDTYDSGKYDSHKSFDLYEKSRYTLYDMSRIYTNLETERALFLYMINQTTGTVHIEEVDWHCKDIDQALNFRNELPLNTPRGNLDYLWIV